VTYIKGNRLRWAGHVIQLDEQSPTRRTLVAVVEGKRPCGGGNPRTCDSCSAIDS
jgi:hypothetical protein